MKKGSLIVLTLCLLLSACTPKTPVETPPDMDPPLSGSQQGLTASHSHVYENGKCTVCNHDIPYEITYVSNGDGTCYVSVITVDPSCKENFVLTVPKQSPAGDTVTSVQCAPFDRILPYMLTVADFEEIKATMEENVASGKMARLLFLSFTTSFTKQSLSEKTSDRAKEQLLALYPITAVTDVYTLNSDVDKQALASYLERFGEYTAEAFTTDHKHLLHAVNESNVANKEEILASIPSLPQSVGYHITEIRFPDTLTHLDWALYTSCPNLTDAVLPSGITEIPEQALEVLTKLERVTVPNGVTSIGDRAFQNCEALQRITLPVTLTQIAPHAFHLCNNLKSIFWCGTWAQWEAVVANSSEHLQIPNGAVVYFFTESKPDAGINGWHYVNGVPTVWEA